MKEATEFGNDQSAKENEDALEDDPEVRQDRDHQPDAGAGRGDAQGDDAGLQGRGRAGRSSP